ncbi:integrase-like catalytic domain superfamily [Holotrichia oblita]|uniref:Integrase-like catalytic domain superfamily n=1 Tax=Holotrichia oblita TaxID=644536 RepID=A0ACB9SR86_HOLOL|nr:integrase-like catalytic domain superfamily [Holotrichia oblita]
MPRVRRRQNYHRDRDRTVVYQDVGLSYGETGRRVNCTAMAVMRMCRVWIEEARGTRRRPIDQARRTTERQDRRFRQLALRERFATTLHIADQRIIDHEPPLDELCNMKVADVDLQEDIIVINIPHTKNKSCRKFVIVEPMWIDVVTRYLLIRPSPDIPRLFIGFRSGKPTRQNMGHNTISSSAIKIAT